MCVAYSRILTAPPYATDKSLNPDVIKMIEKSFFIKHNNYHRANDISNLIAIGK